MKMRRMFLYAAVFFLTAFALWTGAVCTTDVQAIGADGTRVGLASFNAAVRDLIGTNMELYILTDRLSLIPVGCMAYFALLGLQQWIARKSIRKVDRSILLLGGLYLLLAAAYLFFEMHIINYRPVLIEGRLEASYPSSTTVLVLCVMPTALSQLRIRVQNRQMRMVCTAVCAAFTVFMVIGRLLSGVHWCSDIIGGIFLSTGLTALYFFLIRSAK